MKKSKASTAPPCPSNSFPSNIAVMPETCECLERARTLALQLTLPFVALEAPETVELVLRVGLKGLTLIPTDRRYGGGIAADFVHGAAAKRRQATGFTRQPLAKALGFKAGRPSVIDATAGLGRDAFQMASLGCNVVAIERSPVLASMLNDALDHARRKNDSQLTAIVNRIQVMEADSKVVLASLDENHRTDVVYLDPMYTPRTSSALAKKEMRILRMLVGGDVDAGELLKIARQAATKRVVVKRHLRAKPLAEGVMQSYPGRTVRYDVYQPV